MARGGEMKMKMMRHLPPLPTVVHGDAFFFAALLQFRKRAFASDYKLFVLLCYVYVLLRDREKKKEKKGGLFCTVGGEFPTRSKSKSESVIFRFGCKMG